MNLKERLLPIYPKVVFSPFFGGKDCHFTNPEFEKADLRVCVLFTGEQAAKHSSSTVISLHEIVKEAEERVGKTIFFDYCFQPSPDELKVMKKNDLPECFGWVSQRELKDFDVLLMSFSIHYEIMNAFQILYNSGISPYHHERMKNKDPLIMGGGNVATILEPLYGHEKGAYLDVTYIGEGEDRGSDVIGWLAQNCGSAPRDPKIRIIESLVTTFDNIYYPNGYEHVFKGDRLQEIKKIYDWVPDKVKFFRSFKKTDPVFAKRILATANNTIGKADMRISSGCSGGGQCTFSLKGSQLVTTSDGMIPIMDLVGKSDYSVAVDSGTDKVSAGFSHGEKEVYKYTTKRGYSIEATPDHRVRVINSDGNYDWEEIHEVKGPVRLALKVGADMWATKTPQFDGKDITEDFAHINGFILGDGHVDKKNKVRMYVKDKEGYLRDMFNSVFGDSRSCIVYNTVEQGPIYEVIESGPASNHKVIDFMGIKAHSPEIRVPAWVFTAPRNLVIEFIRGFCQADGSLSGKTKTFYVNSTSEKFIDGMQVLLLNLGILTNKSIIRHSEKEFEDGYNRSDYHQLSTVHPYSIQKYIDVIGFKVGDDEKMQGELGNDSMWKYPNIGTKQINAACGMNKEERQRKGVATHYEGLTRFTLGRLRKHLPDENQLSFYYDNNLYFEEIVKVESLGIHQVYDITTPKTETFVAQGFVVHNCLEGQEQGVWREQDDEHLIKQMDILKDYGAPNSVTFFSLNSPYKARILGLYKELAKRFSRFSVIALRADVVAAEPEYLRLLRTLKVMKVSIALEGVSDRIRNCFLNKTISWEQFHVASERTFQYKFNNLKINLIITGQEEEQDFDEFAMHLRKMFAARDKQGVNCGIQLCLTMLVTYNGAALRWTPRKATSNELLKKKVFKSLTTRLKDLRIRYSFHTGDGFVLQQTLVDMGRLCTDQMTPILQRIADSCEIPTRAGVHRELYCSVFKAHGYNTKEEMANFFLRTYEFEDAFPDDIFEVHKREYERKVFDAIGKKPLPYCLSTVANEKTKCYDCGQCPDMTYAVENILKRKHDLGGSIEEIQKVSFENKPKSTLRVILKMRDDIQSRYRPKIVQSHYIASHFLRESKALHDSFYHVTPYADYYISAEFGPDNFGGLLFFDLNMKMDYNALNAIDLDKIVKSINLKSECSDIVGYHVINYAAQNERRLRSYVWQFETSLPGALLADSFAAYNGEARVIDLFYGGSYTFKTVPLPKADVTLKQYQVGNKTIGYFTLPNTLNPILVGTNFFSMPLKVVKEKFIFTRTDLFDKVPTPCSSAGCNEEAGHNIVTNKQAKYCAKCTAKLRISLIKKKFGNSI